MATSTNFGWTEPDDTDLVKNGASAMRTLGNAIDSTLWTVGGYTAGKNKVINGDFGIWQRGTSFTNPADGSYTADRFEIRQDGNGTKIISQQTFTPGTAPVAGYEGQYFFRWNDSVAGSTQSYKVVAQKIEDVRTFAGQTVTFSFWAKADASRTVAFYLEQNFGSGGSATVTSTSTNASLTTSWTRFSATISLASISGKTIGTGSSLRARFDLPLNVAQTIDLWGVQVEAGSTATPFQTATGTKQGELAACQRYYYRISSQGRYGTGYALTTTVPNITIPFPQVMRVSPSALEQSGTASDYLIAYQNTASACTAVPIFSSASQNCAVVSFTVGAVLTAGNGLNAGSNSANAYLGWSAEL